MSNRNNSSNSHNLINTVSRNTQKAKKNIRNNNNQKQNAKKKRNAILSSLSGKRKKAVRNRKMTRNNRRLFNKKRNILGSSFSRIKKVNKLINKVKNPDLDNKKRVNKIELSLYGAKKPGSISDRINTLEFNFLSKKKPDLDLETRISILEKYVRNTSKYHIPDVLMSKSFKYFIHPSLNPEPEIISVPEQSGSKSLVLEIKTNKNMRFILKITKIPSLYVDTKHSALAEYNFYTIMKQLISYNITPHVFRGVGKVDTFYTGSISKYNSKYSLIKSFFPNDNVFVMLTETNMDYNSNIYPLYKIFSTMYMSLRDIEPSNQLRKLKKNLTNIYNNLFFEIMYTLVVFKKLKFKHNDLHTGNILVIFSENNIYLDTLDDYTKNIVREYEFEYTGKKVNVFIPNTGITSRIFDYDRSCLISKKGEIRNNHLEDKFKVFYQDCNNNFYRDTYKFLCGFYDIIKKFYKFPFFDEIYKPLTDFIENCFYQDSLLRQGKVTDDDGNEIIIDPSFKEEGAHRFYYVSEPIDKYMKSPEEILFEFSKNFSYKVNNKYVKKNNKPNIVPFQKFSTLKMQEEDLIPENIFKNI